MINKVHFIGIGGVGMSALARWFKSRSWKVSGSDADSGSIIAKQLRRDGIKVLAGHYGKNIPKKTTVVIRSQAIDKDNPELRTAIKNNIPVFSYPEALGFISQEYTTIAIAGAHGKSTTTALTALALVKGKLDPTVIIGTILKEFAPSANRRSGSNFRRGTSPLLVLEADEYGKAFLYYSPMVTVITNIDREHLDVYSSLQGIQKNFLLFASHTLRGGVLVVNRDDKNLRGLERRIHAIARKNKLKIFWYSIKDKEASLVEKNLRIAGTHNFSNALAAYTVAAKVFKIPPKAVLGALRAYKGSWRRMEYRGGFKLQTSSFKKKAEGKEPSLKAKSLKLNVFDDYAHHPTEIKATLSAFREKLPDSPLICAFEPHQALRLQKLFKEFSDSFENSDAVLLLPAYQVRGRDKINPRFTSETLAKAIQKKYPNKPVLYVSNPKNFKRALSEVIPLLPPTYHLPPTLVMMGAGNIVKLTDILVK